MRQKKNPKVAVRNQRIAQDRLVGMTYRDLARKYNISKSRVAQILTMPEMKDVIDTGANQMVSLVPLACQVHLNALQSDNLALAFKAAETVLKVCGIIPAHITNQTIHSIINMDHNSTIAPAVADLLLKLSRQNEFDIIS